MRQHLSERVTACKGGYDGQVLVDKWDKPLLVTHLAAKICAKIRAAVDSAARRYLPTKATYISTYPLVVAFNAGVIRSLPMLLAKSRPFPQLLAYSRCCLTSLLPAVSSRSDQQLAPQIRRGTAADAAVGAALSRYLPTKAVR